MRRVDWSTIVDQIRGVPIVGTHSSPAVDRVSTDSRSLCKGDLFFALQGERFDGHDFVESAIDRGAAACVVGKSRVPHLTEIIRHRGDAVLIAVDDTLEALERLAVWNRDACGLLVTAITGSVGKTTTKEFLCSILATRFNVTAAPKSFNNRIGVATTLLLADERTEQLIVEMGTSGRGEISHLSKLVRPDQVVVTTIAPAHLAGLRDIEGVVDAKIEILDGLSSDGTAFLNAEMTGCERFCEILEGRPLTKVVTFGRNTGDARPEGCELCHHEDGSIAYRFTLGGDEFLLAVPGRHNVLNATAAICVARCAGLDVDQIRAGLEQSRLPPQRLDVHIKDDVLIIDDSYNANPCSMESALETLEELAKSRLGGRRVAVLGDMRELGGESRVLHEELGRRLAQDPVDLLVTVGDDSRHLSNTFERETAGRDSGSRVEHFDRVEDAAVFLGSVIRGGDKVLIKASNSVGVDRIAKVLLG